MKIDADPRGEPVVTKLVQQPIKFNDAPVKNVKIVKQKKVVKDAQPKVEKKKVSKKVNSDKVEKKGKHVKRVQKNWKTEAVLRKFSKILGIVSVQSKMVSTAGGKVLENRRSNTLSSLL